MTVFDVTRAELGRMNALESVEGQIALALAAVLDEPRAGMAVAGDARELRTVMSVIRERSVKKADPIDELNARRARGSVPKAG